MSENREVKIVTLEHINRRLDDLEHMLFVMIEALKMLLVFGTKEKLESMDELMAHLLILELTKITDKFFKEECTESDMEQGKEAYELLIKLLNKDIDK